MGRPGLFSPGGQAQFEVHAELPLDEPVIAAAAAVLEGVAEGARAFWGHATPDAAAAGHRVSDSTHAARAAVPTPGAARPEALRAHPLARDSLLPRVAELLVCRCRRGHRVSGPCPRRGAAVTRHGVRESGGWVVQLTDAPLDLDNPAHLDALKRAYERFPEIGGRATP